MLVSRILALTLRLLEFTFAAIVLGLTAHFLHQRDRYHIGGPYSRLIYTITIASLSLPLSLLFMLPFALRSLAIPLLDLLLSLAWFAVFGVLQNWHHRNISCGNWFGVGARIGWFWNGWCEEWRADLAFSFLAAVCWFASFLLGVWVWSRRDRHAERVQAAPATGQGNVGRRRFFRKSQV